MTAGYIIHATTPHFQYLCHLSWGLLWNGTPRQGVTVWPTRHAARRAVVRQRAHAMRCGWDSVPTYTVRRLVSSAVNP